MESRITLNPDVCHGRPTIRNLRFTVSQVVEILAGGMSTDEILQDYPFLEAADSHECLAARQLYPAVPAAA